MMLLSEFTIAERRVKQNVEMSTKPTQNVFRSARNRAAQFNDRFNSREGAAAEMGLDRTRLARIELGVLNPYPEEVLIMASSYNAPELRNFYCRTMCPLGKDLPEVKEETLDRISIEALSSFRKVESAKELLLDITEDGIIDDSEKKDLQKIIDTLDEVSRISTQLKNWAEKNL